MLLRTSENASGYSASYSFAADSNNLNNAKMHKTPVWFPDGEYSVKYEVYDLWTPAGMLTGTTYAIVNIEGSLYDAIYESALKYPYNTAIEYSNRQITYKNLIKRINKCAKALKAIGVNKGDKVSICMPNTPEEVIMFYAINEIVSVTVQTNNSDVGIYSKNDLEIVDISVNDGNGKIVFWSSLFAITDLQLNKCNIITQKFLFIFHFIFFEYAFSTYR